MFGIARLNTLAKAAATEGVTGSFFIGSGIGGTTSFSFGHCCYNSVGDVIIGYTTNSATLIGTQDVILLKINATTNAITWQFRFGLSANTNYIQNMQVDGSDNIWIQVNANIVFKVTTAGGYGAAVRTITTSGLSTTRSNMVIDPSDNIYLASTTTTASGDFSLTQMTNTLVAGWGRQYGTTTSAEYMGNLAMLGGASPAVYASFWSGTSNICPIGKWNTSGTNLWFNTLSTSGSQIPIIAVDVGGNVYARGTISAVQSLSKLTSAGAHSWSRTLSGATFSTRLGVDSSGDVYILNRIDSGTIGLMKIDSTGAEVWQRAFVFTAGVVETAVIGPNPSTLPASQSQFTINGSQILFGAQITNTSGQTVPLFFKLPTDGTKTGSYTLGSISFTYGASTAITVATPTQPTISAYTTTTATSTAPTISTPTARTSTASTPTTTITTI
jgi:hypothetical protein